MISSLSNFIVPGNKQNAQHTRGFYYPESKNTSILVFIFLIPFVITPFSPFYAYIVTVFIMVGLSKFITKGFRISLSLLLAFNIALLYASRLYFNTAPYYDDDFSRYYQNYLDIYDGIQGAMVVWGNEYEVGLPVFFKILSFFLPKLTPQYVLFFIALSIAILFYIWLEKYGSKFVKDNQKSALIAFTISLSVIVDSAGLMRQGFASMFLLYGFFCKPIHLKIIFFAIAIGFHQSSALVIALFYAIYYFPRSSLTIFLVIFILFMTNNFVDIGPILQNISSRIGDYFKYYLDGKSYNAMSLIHTNIIRIILMICILFSLYIVNYRDKLTCKFRILILISFTIYIAHIFPTRSVMLVNDILFYFILFIVLRRYLTFMLLFLFPYFLRIMWNFLIANERPETLPIELFFSYPHAHFYPFYYFFQGVINEI